MKKASVLLISGEAEDERPIWCFLVVSTEDVEAVMLAQEEAETFYPEDFGAIVASGEGEQPSAEVMQRMADEYGFEAEKMVSVDMQQAAEIAQQAKATDSHDPRYFVEPWDLDRVRIVAAYERRIKDPRDRP